MSDLSDAAPTTVRRTTGRRGQLTDKKIESLTPEDKDYKKSDGNSLYLLVKTSGTKLWRFKYHFAGKEKLMPLGQYPEIRLAVARQKRDDARQLILEGRDPMHERKTMKVAQKIAASNSFKSVAEQWWKRWSTSQSERHAGQTWRRLESNVFPLIGARPVGEIQASELIQVLRKMEGRGAIDLAKRALQTCSQVFRFAVGSNIAQRDPTKDIRAADILPSMPVKNLARIDAKDLPLLLRHIEAYQGSPLTRFALQLIALTFVRTTELIEARWSEFDLDGALWTIPAERMKMKRAHVVPLSRQAVNVLRALHLVSGHRELLFPGQRNHESSMSNNTICMALGRMGYQGDMTGHGFRGLASTILHENEFDHAHIELQLSHAQKDRVAAAYNHATYLRQRSEMMQWYADYLDRCKNGNVVPLHRSAA